MVVLTVSPVGQDDDITGHLQKILAQIGSFCLVTIGIIVIAEVFVLYAGFRYRYRAGLDNILVLLIGGIPIAMPTVLSVTLAVGAQQLAKYRAIVTRITAIEEFAGVTIPCSELWPPASSPSTATLSKHFLPLTPHVRKIRTPSTCPSFRHSEKPVLVPESNCSTSSRQAYRDHTYREESSDKLKRVIRV